MATKLKGLKVKKVDFVDQGANPEAYIQLFKRKEEEQPKSESVLKRFLEAICKVTGVKSEEIVQAVEEIEKGEATTFKEKINEAGKRKISDEIWNVCYALESSLCSILYDEGIENTQETMIQSVNEFTEVIRECIKQWAQGKESCLIKKEMLPDLNEEEVEKMEKLIEKSKGKVKSEKQEKQENQEGEQKEMKIDKSKMTPAERVFFEEIEKRCAIEEEANTEGTKETDVEKKAENLNKNPLKMVEVTQAEELYKGIHPMVAAELESLRKFREAAEEKELTEVAKKYELLGKKPEELVPVLKSLKAAGGTAYQDMLSVFDTNLDTIQKSGVFGEIGRTGGAENQGAETQAVAKLKTKVLEIRKARPDLSEAQAMDQALLEDEELRKEFDQ